MLDKAEHLSNKPSTLTHTCLMKTVVNLTHSPTPSFNIVRAKNIILGRIFVQVQQIVLYQRVSQPMKQATNSSVLNIPLGVSKWCIGSPVCEA